MPLDLNGTSGTLGSVLMQVQPQHVVVTAGINQPESDEDLVKQYQAHFAANVIGPMQLLHAWRSLLSQQSDIGMVRHYVAISSNSARVPRSNSAPYCASKAALSQALRVKAREVAASAVGRATYRLAVYGYEPGLLASTPMTADTVAQFGSGVPLTRMRHPELAHGFSPERLAKMVVHNLGLGLEMNGMLVPLDADEA